MLPAKESLPNPLPDPLAAAAAPHRNSWNHFAGRVSAAVMRETADRFVALGLRDVGYIYINSDDTWAELNRSASGRLVPKPSFGGPGDAGIRALCAVPLAPPFFSPPPPPAALRLTERCPAVQVGLHPPARAQVRPLYAPTPCRRRCSPASSSPDRRTHPSFPCLYRWRGGVDDLCRICWRPLPRARGRGDPGGVGR